MKNAKMFLVNNIWYCTDYNSGKTTSYTKDFNQSHIYFEGWLFGLHGDDGMTIKIVGEK